MNTQKDVKNWYNDFSKKQLKTGVNLRHYKIMNELIKVGLRRDSKVLEIGCGIGTLTGLLNKYLTKGKLVAADISDESIAIAKTRIANSEKIDFVTTDMQDFKYPSKFDFIVLPDVIEHIPVEQHKGLFNCIAENMHENSIVFIHVPHPKGIEFARIHMPEKLQIIDQALSADRLMQDIYANGLILISYISYSLFVDQTDYVIIVLQKNKSLNYNTLPTLTIVKKKWTERIKYLLSSF